MSVRREVAKSAVLSLVAILAVSVGGFSAARTVATREAVRQAEQATELVASTVIAPALDDGLLRGDPAAIEQLDAVVQETVLGERILNVRVWSADGQILYADDLADVGEHFPLEEDELGVIRTGRPHAELSDLHKEENADQTQFGQLLEVYVAVETPEGTRLLFETYQSTAGMQAATGRILRAFAPVMLGILTLLGLVQIALSWRLARTLEQAQEEREEMLQRALTASEAERRSIATDLHDGVVQDLVGLTFTLDALAGRAADDEQTRGLLAGAATTTRSSVRSLRSLLVEIYPPNLEDVGLAGALEDLVAAVGGDRMRTSVRVDPGVELAPPTRAAVYRIARESLSNARKHADAEHLEVRLAVEGARPVLTITDDGVGFDPQQPRPGHMGQRMMHDVAASVGALLSVQSAPGQGTTLRMELPA